MSEAARSRAIKRGPGFLGFLLAHHWPGQLERCYLIWIGQRPIWLCARCLGLYPVLIGLVAIQLVWRIHSGWWDIPWLFLSPLPAAWDWSASRLRGQPGRNVVRTLTGAVLGLGLGRAVFLNMIQPGHVLVVIQLAALTLFVVAVELAARLGKHRSRSGK